MEPARTPLQLLCSLCHYNIFYWSISLFVSCLSHALYLLSFLLCCALSLMHKRDFIIALTLRSGPNPVFFFFCRFDDDDPRLHFQFFSFFRSSEGEKNRRDEQCVGQQQQQNVLKCKSIFFVSWHKINPPFWSC